MMTRWRNCREDCFNCPYPDCIKPTEKCSDKATWKIEDQALLNRVTDDISDEIKKNRERNNKTREYKKKYMKAYRQSKKDGTYVPKRPHRKVCIQYSIDGEELNRFRSVAEAARSIGGKERMIGKACRGDNLRGRKHGAYGYDWKYE